MCRDCCIIEGKYHECNERFCSQCLKEKDLGHECYMSPLSDRAPRSVKVLYVFYDFEITHAIKRGDPSFEHVPNPVCV